MLMEKIKIKLNKSEFMAVMSAIEKRIQLDDVAHRPSIKQPIHMISNCLIAEVFQKHFTKYSFPKEGKNGFSLTCAQAGAFYLMFINDHPMHDQYTNATVKVMRDFIHQKLI
jgi:hypothetical protein